MRQRWVDDLFLLIVTDTPIPENDQSKVHNIMENMYKPFKLKVEDAEVFVGFRPLFEGGRIQFSIATRRISL